MCACLPQHFKIGLLENDQPDELGDDHEINFVAIIFLQNQQSLVKVNSRHQPFTELHSQIIANADNVNCHVMLCNVMLSYKDLIRRLIAEEIRADGICISSLRI